MELNMFNILLIGVCCSLLISLSLWRLFEKANEAGWFAFIPGYNFVVLTRIIGKPAWWTLMYFIPIVNIYFLIRATYLLARSFGKSYSFTIGLLIFSFIYFPVLAFSNDSSYLGPYGKIEPIAEEDILRFEFES